MPCTSHLGPLVLVWLIHWEVCGVRSYAFWGANISVAPVAGFYSSVEIVPKAQVESAFRPFSGIDKRETLYLTKAMNLSTSSKVM
jgi:hypothetical protein